MAEPFKGNHLILSTMAILKAQKGTKADLSTGLSEDEIKRRKHRDQFNATLTPEVQARLAGAYTSSGALSKIGAAPDAMAKAVGYVVNKARPYTKPIANKISPVIDRVKVLLKRPTPEPFKSEINWGSWNKEIPNNKALMDEYNAIEQTAKANKTWLKNPDGSKFVGTNPTQKRLNSLGFGHLTPEEAIKMQFIETQGSNFKRSFPNPMRDSKGHIQTNYHGTKHPLEGDQFKVNTNEGELGPGIYTTVDDKYATTFSRHYDNWKPIESPESRVYELYQNTNNPQKAYTTYTDWANKKIAEFNKNTKFLPKFTDKYKALNKELETVLAEKHGYNKDTKQFTLRPEFDSFTMGHQTVVPFTNNPKSAIGNNGMWDMTKSNIHKSVVPLAVATGAGLLKKKQNTQ